LGLPSRTMLIPLVQQFISYSGEDVNTTAFRLIEPPRFSRRLVSLSQAAMADPSSCS
jgi:hypothetical protein